MTTYQQQALDFLSQNNLKMRITLSDSKPAHWSPSGHHYRVTIYREGQSNRITFDFWGSLNDMQNNENPEEYDILAAISGDVYCPDDFKEFCSEYGYSEDSIEALQTFKRADRFAKRLREFFTDSEVEKLSEIR